MKESKNSKNSVYSLAWRDSTASQSMFRLCEVKVIVCGPFGYVLIIVGVFPFARPPSAASLFC